MSSDPYAVIFVCLGNICRSPLAKGLFLSKVQSRGWAADFRVESAGTSSYHVGDPPDPGSVRVARDVGIDLSNDRASQINRTDMKTYDLVVALDRSNQRDLLRFGSEFRDKIRLLRGFEADPVDLDVPDPWGGGLGSFKRTFDIVDQATDGLIQWLQGELSLS